MVIFISVGRSAVTFVTPVSTSMRLPSAISLPSDPCWDRGQPLTRYVQKAVCQGGRGGVTKSSIFMYLFHVLISPTLTPLPLPPLSFSLLPLSSLSQSPGDEIDGPYAVFPGDQV